MSSILTDIKKLLGIDEDYTFFDTDIIIHINSAFATLHQLGVGPDEAFTITDKTDDWSGFIEDDAIESVKTYVYIKVRLVFDTPGTSYIITSFENMAKELEWRLNVRSENNTPIATP